MATNTYVALDKVTVGTAASSITFSSIPSTYTDLVIVMSPATTHTSATFPYVRFNGDSGSNYSYTEVNGSGTSPTSARDVNQTIGWTAPQMGSISNTLGDNTTIVNIMNYSNSATHKTYLSRANRAGSALDYQGVELAVGLWRNTAAITSVTIGNRRGGVDYNFAVGSTFSLYGIRAEGVSPTTKATGGAVYSDANYYYHVFGASGTFTPNQSLTCDYLVVAGGGAGGNYGGGGAGGLRSTVTATGGGGSLESPLSLTAQSYAVTVGAGGSSAVQNNPTNGSNSVFSTITSTGGGRGSFSINGVGTTGPNAGGSGGGGIWTSGAGGAASPSGQGFAGGSGGGGSPGPFAAGGGGGAGAAGQAGQATVGGNGGIGVAIPAFALTTGTGINNYYAGGGGGAHFNGTGSNSSGGAGGGGTGGKNDTGDTAGIVSTGGGGGGSGTSDASGNNGGSGIVVIRYAK